MKKVIVDFKQSVFEDFEGLCGDKRLGGLAERYYRELFDFPPEEWGRLRREFGKDTFVSDHHIPFIIKVIVVEERADFIHLYVTEFSPR
jgi:hypothetical protein